MQVRRITTRFGSESTAEEVLEGVDLVGRTAVVTGGASGIGRETARVLAAHGARVTIAVRDMDMGEKAAQGIGIEMCVEPLDVAHLDLADLDSVAYFAFGWAGPLDILVLNAGGMAMPLERTPAGIEMHLATNHLGHFALASWLRPALASADEPRVVSVSSVDHLAADVDFEDINFERRGYDPLVAYGQSKTANILFAVEASRRWQEDGILVNALNPGRIPTTRLIRHTSPERTREADAAPPEVSVKDVHQGAATSALLAASPLVEASSGRYFEDCNEATPCVPGIRHGVAPYALDATHAARLWGWSEKMLGGAAPVQRSA
jgi:NAD(P)-dependent dehydrogenase (short-subunit alcohol dehydrogenase family)